MSPQNLVRRSVASRAKGDKVGRHMRLSLDGEQPDGATVVDLFHGRGAALFADSPTAGHRFARRHGAILAQRWCCDTAIGRLGAITPEKAAEPVGPLFGARQ